MSKTVAAERARQAASIVKAVQDQLNEQYGEFRLVSKPHATRMVMSGLNRALSASNKIVANAISEGLLVEIDPRSRMLVHLPGAPSDLHPRYLREPGGEQATSFGLTTESPETRWGAFRTTFVTTPAHMRQLIADLVEADANAASEAEDSEADSDGSERDAEAARRDPELAALAAKVRQQHPDLLITLLPDAEDGINILLVANGTATDTLKPALKLLATT